MFFWNERYVLKANHIDGCFLNIVAAVRNSLFQNLRQWQNHKIVSVECLQMMKYFFLYLNFVALILANNDTIAGHWAKGNDLLKKSEKWRRNYLFIWNELFGHNSDCLSSLHPNQRPEDPECRCTVNNIWTFFFFTSDSECRCPVNSISWPLFLSHFRRGF